MKQLQVPSYMCEWCFLTRRGDFRKIFEEINPRDPGSSKWREPKNEAHHPSPILSVVEWAIFSVSLPGCRTLSKIAGYSARGYHVRKESGCLKRKPVFPLGVVKSCALFCFILFPSWPQRKPEKSLCLCRTWVFYEQMGCWYTCTFIVFPIIWVLCWVWGIRMKLH